MERFAKLDRLLYHARHDGKWHTMKPDIRRIMTRSVRTVHRDAFIGELAGIFDDERIGGAPLVDDSGEIIGVVSKTDISHFEHLGGDPNVARAWEIASSEVRSIDAGASLEEAAQAMIEHRVHRLIVLEDDAIAGILTSLDFVSLVASGKLTLPDT